MPPAPMAAARRREDTASGAAPIPGGAERARQAQRRSEAVAAGANAVAGQRDPPSRHVEVGVVGEAGGEEVRLACDAVARSLEAVHRSCGDEDVVVDLDVSPSTVKLHSDSELNRP
jgi:hypothetical protein